jgi:hypothetical protein
LPAAAAAVCRHAWSAARWISARSIELIGTGAAPVDTDEFAPA